MCGSSSLPINKIVLAIVKSNGDAGWIVPISWKSQPPISIEKTITSYDRYNFTKLCTKKLKMKFVINCIYFVERPWHKYSWFSPYLKEMRLNTNLYVDDNENEVKWIYQKHISKDRAYSEDDIYFLKCKCMSFTSCHCQGNAFPWLNN